MKKLLLILALLCFSTEAFAARTTGPDTIIASTTLDADPTSASGTKEIKSADKTAIFVTYDETEVGGISAAVTIDVSQDNSTWLDAPFYDTAGGATLQTSETLSADGNYVLWLPSELPVKYIRVVIAATGSDADDTAVVSAKIITQE